MRPWYLNRNALSVLCAVVIALVSCVSAAILSLTEGFSSVSFLQAFSLSVSAFTSTGLLVVDYSNFSAAGSSALIVLMQLGGSWTISLLVAMGVAAATKVDAPPRREVEGGGGERSSGASSSDMDQVSMTAEGMSSLEHRGLTERQSSFSS